MPVRPACTSPARAPYFGECVGLARALGPLFRIQSSQRRSNGSFSKDGIRQAHLPGVPRRRAQWCESAGARSCPCPSTTHSGARPGRRRARTARNRPSRQRPRVRSQVMQTRARKPRGAALHPARQARAERLHRKLQQPLSRRANVAALVHSLTTCAASFRTGATTTATTGRIARSTTCHQSSACGTSHC